MLVLLVGLGGHSNAQQLVVPDSFPTIQSAIDAAGPGDTVVVREGSYHEFLVMKDSVILRSEGVDDVPWARAMRTMIHSEGLRDAGGLITPVVNLADGSVLDGFTVTGMDTVNHHLPGHSHAVQNRGVSGTVMHCIVHSNGSTGIGSHDMNGREANPVVYHNKVYRNFGIGIGFNHTSKGIASNNTVFENREVGIGVQNGASPMIVNNIVYENGWNGISAREGAWPEIAGNTVYSNGRQQTGDGMPDGAGTGIGLDSTGHIARPGATPSEAVVHENNVHDNPGGGIMSRNHSRIVVDSNLVSTNGNFQISVSDWSTGWIGKNTATIAPDSGIDAGGIVVARHADATVSQNHLNALTGAGIVVDSAVARIDGNVVWDCLGAGMLIHASDAVIANNWIARSGGPAISLQSASADLHHNVMHMNLGGGIVAESDSYAHIYNNTIVAQAGSSIPGRGIAATGPTVVVRNNIIYGYTVGVYMTGNPDVDYNCTFDNQGYNGPPGSGGQHSVSGNPMFINGMNSDFHLSAGSPCIDTGDPDSRYNDPDGSRCDIGRYPYGTATAIASFASISDPVLEAYPTLTRGQVTVARNGSTTEKLELHIVSVDGRVMKTVRLEGSSVRFGTSDLAPGLYIVSPRNSSLGAVRFVVLR